MKKKYIEFLTSAKQLSQTTAESKLKSIYKYDDYTKQSDYKTLNTDTARAFQKYLQKLTFRNQTISGQTVYQTLKDVQEFFVWLSEKPGYKSKISYEKIQHLNPSFSTIQMANNRPPRAYPTNLTYIKKLILSIKGTEEIDLRDKAIIAMLIMTGMRVEALATLPVGCVDMDRWLIDQNPDKGVKTKFSKRIYTVIIKIDSIFVEAVEEWFQFLKKKNVPSTHPLFPKADHIHEQGTFIFINNKLSDRCMRGSQISRILQERCKQASEKYYSAHTLRHLHERTVEKAAGRTEQIKALSQNMGHNNLYTTLDCYGYINDTDRINILNTLDFRGIS